MKPIEMRRRWLSAASVIARLIIASPGFDPVARSYTAPPQASAMPSRRRDPRLASACADRSFDHLVGAQQDRGRDGEAERLGGLEIENRLERGRLLHRQVAGLGALENPRDTAARQAIGGAEARSVAHQAARRDEFAPGEHRRNRMPCGEQDELRAAAGEERIAL